MREADRVHNIGAFIFSRNEFLLTFSNMKKETLSIVEYEDYREFIRDHYLYSKSLNSKISLEYIAKRISITKGFLNLVMKKKRHLSVDSIFKVTNFFKLNQLEFQFLFFQILFHTTKEKEAKTYFQSIVKSYKFYFKKTKGADISAPPHQLELDEKTLVNQDWVAAAIHSLSDFKGFKMDPDWIHERLGGDLVLSRSQAVEGIKKVQYLIDEGRIALGKDDLKDVHPADINDHRRFITGLRRVEKAIDLRGKTALHRPSRYQLYTLSLSEEEIRKVIGLYEKFEKDILEIASQSTKRDRLILLSNNIIPISI
jgi:uncharacterized protein (TIGR02147 family)